MNSTDDIIKEAIALAKTWQDRANDLMVPLEKKRYKQLARLLANPKDKILLAKLIDQSFRSANPRRVADQIRYLLAEYGTPGFFPPFERLLMQLFKVLGLYLSGFTVPKVIAKMRSESNHAIIPGEADELHAYLRKRKDQGIRININHLGEAVLGEEEAERRGRQEAFAAKERRGRWRCDERFGPAGIG